MSSPSAARLGDGLLHVSIYAELTAGVLEVAAFAAVGFAVGVGLALAGLGTVVTGGILGCVVIGIIVGVATNLSGLDTAISRTAKKIGNALFPPGIEANIVTGSESVFTNKIPAARAAFEIVPAEPEPSEAPDMSAWDIASAIAQQMWRPTIATAAPGTSPLPEDVVLCKKHPPNPIQYIAEGSSSVFINGHPAARSGDRSTCEATIGLASQNVFIGGETITGRDIESESNGAVLLLLTALSLLRGKPSKQLTQILPCLGMMVGTSIATSALANAIKGGPHPVHAATGIKVLGGPEDLDFFLPGLLPIEWQRFYNSRDTNNGDRALLGTGWRTPYEVEVFTWRDAHGTERMTYVDEQGRRTELDAPAAGESAFIVSDGLSVRRTEHGAMLIESVDGLYRAFEPDPQVAGRQRLAFLSDRNRNEVHLSYDALGRLSSICDAERLVGVELRYGAAHAHRVSHIERLYFEPTVEGHHGERFEVIVHAHAAQRANREVQVVRRELLVQYHHDAAGNLVQVVNAPGQVTRRFEYDSGHRMVMHQTPTGQTCRYEWSTLLGPHPEQGPEWRVSRYWSDVGDEYRFEYVYNLEQRQGGTRITDGLGRVSTRYWNADYQITCFQDEAGKEWRFDWDEHRQLLGATDPQGGRWAYGYDEWGNQTAQTDPLGRRETTAWHSHWSLPRSESDASGARWFYQYDGYGNLISETDPLGQTTRYEVNRQGLVTAETDALGKRRQMGYNALGQLIEHVDCTGSVTHFHYDERGHLKEVVDAQGHSTVYGHDVLGLLRQMRLSDGREEFYGRNAAGQLVHHVNAAGQSTHYHYRPDGLLRQRVDASGHSVSFDHDAYLRLLKLSNENNEEHRFEYDEVGQVTAQHALDGSAQRYRYDALGQIVEVAYHPAPMGTGMAVVSAQVAQAAQGPIVHRLQRDAVGQLISKTTADGQTRYSYDKSGRILKVQFEPAQPEDKTGQGTPSMKAHSLSFQYDALGRLIQENTTAGSLKHAYDPLGNLLKTELPDGRVLQRLYYGSGHLHQIRLDDTVVSDFERDPLHREVLRTQGRLHQQTRYDKSGRIQQRQRWLNAGALQADPSKGFIGNYRGGATQHNGRLLSEQDYRWSAADELVGIDRKEYIQPGRVPQGLSGASAAQQYPLKRVHQILSYGPTGLLQGSSQIEHSGQGGQGAQSRQGGKASTGTPLTQETFHYDRAANLLGSGPSQGGSAGFVHHNKVLVFEDKRYRYDAFGRLLEKRSSRFGVQRFEYDAEHRLIAVHQKPDARKDKGHAGSSTHFEYDALGRRIAKTHQETSASGHQSRPRSTRFGWDGIRLLSETREPLFEQQARHQSLYIYEDEGSYEPLARVDSASGGAEEEETSAQADETKKKKSGTHKVLYFHNDLSGKPEALSSAEQGQVIWRASYKVWGNTIQEEWSGEYAQVDARTVAQNIRFQGQYLDPETGLHYNTFRYYDPDIGRFTTPDPIGLAGGLNLYQYAPNPISWIDPWGWCKGAGAKSGRSKPISLPGAKKTKIDMVHVLDRHTKTGKTAQQSGKKDLFPENMSPRQIERAVKEAYGNGKRILTQGDRVLVQGRSGGKTIEMWVNTKTKIIETAYPKN
jgi:RHS repeat-associated protein